MSVILLELNELNFEYIDGYIKNGMLPAFGRVLDDHGYAETTSENHYEEIEPWIQWVTAHTGLSLAEHGVLRLGDISKKNVRQIWEQLEQDFGMKVGAVSPMNALNRLKEPAFFVPDPWTNTSASGPWLLRRLSSAIAQAVNDNATSRLQIDSLFALLAGVIAYSQSANWPHYVNLSMSRSKKWRRAIFLDLLLSDVFFKQWKRTRPDFSSIFLNAGAHIQHHYMFSSPSYGGNLRNPKWYLEDASADPLLEIYSLYDRVIDRALNLPNRPRVLIATGLHQDPHEEVTFYWRLRDHSAFLQAAGLPFMQVHPLMSRDFLIKCTSSAEAQTVENALVAALASDGSKMFYVDNRGTDLFVMLEYPHDVSEDLSVDINDRTITRFKDHVAFVAIKNGKHNGTGYFIDCGAPRSSTVTRFPLTELPSKIMTAMQLELAPT